MAADGRQLHKYQNLLNRDFHAEAPNRKWVTDISYIQTKQGTLYLSMIRDLYDNSIVAYKTAAQQTVNLVLDTVRQAVRRERRRSPQSYGSTATKVFNTPHKHIST
ncbi:MAG: DDE-type integrase/transposase/recombinase [Neglectibacter timonensis]|uniref:DDE-type integrase/transposase/recombinase n=1 Tax=Neglectibacter timonensis TaxID=1776382 RepID=UPI003991D67E